MRVGLVVALLVLNAAVAGCFGGKGNKKDASDDPLGDSVAAALPVLSLDVKVGNFTYSYTTAVAANATGNATGNATSNTTTTSSTTTTTGNGTGNQTGGNATGNQTGNQTAVKPTVPTGVVPLNVTFTIAVRNATGAFTWTLDAGESAVAGNATTGNATGNATGNSTGNSTTTTSTGPSGNGTGNQTGGNATGNATSNQTAAKAGVTTGNATNQTITHQYTTLGNRTVTFTVKMANGTNVSLKANLVLAAGNTSLNGTLGGSTAGVEVGIVPFDKTGTFTVGVQSPNCGGGVNGAITYDWDLPVLFDGKPVNTKKVTIVITPGTGSVDLGVDFRKPDGTVIKSQDSGLTGAETLTVDGPFPPGLYKVRAFACVAANGSFTVHGDAVQVTV